MSADAESDDSTSDRRPRRRKQPCPVRIIQDPFVLTEALERNVSDECCKANTRTFDNHICGQCSGEFFTMPAFIVHKRQCTNEWPVLLGQKAGNGPPTGTDVDVDDDAGNEPGHSENEEGWNCDVEETEALNLCVNGASADPPSNIDLTMDERSMFTPSLSPDGVAQIQSALRSLQGQQILQLQLIQQIYSQLLSAGADAVPSDTKRSIRPDRFSSSDTHIDQATAVDCSNPQLAARFLPSCNILSPPASGSETSPEQRSLDRLQRSIFDMHAESTTSNDVSAFDALKSQVINSLKEMEQSVAQQIREQRKADTCLDKLYRHRCHFCGKVMSSESSLQIHIRSHTGERPYACSICDSRFSTKGNLKVHMDVHRGEESRNHQRSRVVNVNGFAPNSEISDRRSRKTLLYGTDLLQLDTEETKRMPHAQKSRARSASMSRLNSEKPAKMLAFRDDSTIGNTSSCFFPPADSENFDLDDRESSKEAERLDTPESRDHGSSAMLDPGMLPIDLRVNSTVSSYHSKSPPSITPLMTPSFLPAPFFPALGGLYPNALQMPMQAKQATHVPSTLFMNQPSLLKVTGLDNGTNVSAIANATSPTPVSPANVADMDEDWESMMEITTTDEAEKIKSLVGDRETKVTDPNQCIICHRILSCKSALQMHYRTHTGERPFKCKICSRAFTTKGNLKTHMGVHRTKPPFRLFHQCPICHKKFNNGIVLQQHIRLHTGQAPDMPIEHIQASEIKDSSRPSNAVLDFDRTLQTRLTQPPAAHSAASLLTPPTAVPTINDQGTKRPPSVLISPISTPKPFERTLSTSSVSGGSNLASATRGHSPSQEKATARSRESEEKFPAFPQFTVPPLDLMRGQAGTAAAFASWFSRFGPATPFPLIPFSTSSSPMPTSDGDGQSHGSNGGSRNAIPPPPSSLALPPANPFTPVILPSPSQAPMFGRPNTTCNICFKTFACNSALEIHYRSHTKERPFKCTVCGRGFSTKGNMKQHLLTHKIRDAANSDLSQSHSSSNHGRPSSTTKSNGSDASSPFEHLMQNSNSPPTLSTHAFQVQTPNTYSAEQLADDSNADRGQSHNGDSHCPPHLKRERSPASESVFNGDTRMNVGPLTVLKDSTKRSDKKTEENGGPTPLESIQSMWARTESLATSSPSPAVKRPPVLSKHQCQVCYKHFSSSSALAIHMRTHTGERPFCCPACGRSFTTKGNLKVHMGTHSWQHAQSRRGRRIFDTQQSTLFGHGETASCVGDRSSGATSFDDGSNASSANSDTDQGNGRHTASPDVEDQSRNGSRRGKDSDSRKRKATSPAPFESCSSTPSQSGNGTPAILSPNALHAASLFSSSSPGSSLLPSKANLQNGQLNSLFANPMPMFPSSLSPSSSFAFMNAFQTRLGVPSSSPNFISPNNGLGPNPMAMADPSGSTNPMQTMLWMWRNVCSVCRHVCSSVSELEDHLKLHLANSGGANEKIATSIPT